jgi:hypothetical protein
MLVGFYGGMSRFMIGLTDPHVTLGKNNAMFKAVK